MRKNLDKLKALRMGDQAVFLRRQKCELPSKT